MEKSNQCNTSEFSFMLRKKQGFYELGWHEGDAEDTTKSPGLQSSGLNKAVYIVVYVVRRVILEYNYIISRI